MNIIKKIGIWALLLVSASCNSWLDVAPEDQIMERDLFKNREGFLSALNGVYLGLNHSDSYGASLSMSVVDVMGQYYNANGDDHSFGKYQGYQYDNKNVKDKFDNIWQNAYKKISDLNAILEHCGDGNPVLPDLYYRLIKGESLGLRAMLHFDMLRLFGPVWSDKEKKSIPYQKYSDRRIEPLLSADSIVDCVIADLTAALDLLRDVDPVLTEGAKNYSGGENGNDLHYRQYRLNYYAAKALLARVYMWKQDYSKAKTYAEEVIEAVSKGEKPLFPLCNSAYLDSIKNDRMFESEVLFALYNSKRTDNVYKTYFSPDLNFGGILTLAGNYQSGRVRTMYDTPDDLRFKMWEAVVKEGKEFCCLKKYASIETNTSTPELELERLARFVNMIPLIRMSELYLIAAECEGIHEGHLDIALKNYLNPFRAARRCIDVQAASAAELKVIVRNEYIREFIGEGQTFFYFKRNEMENIPNGLKEDQILNIQLKIYVVPLPDSEISQREEL